jgi:hypothetical protein
MKPATVPLSNGILRGKKMFDPTQTQPLSWRMHQGKPTPLEDVPVDPPNRQAPSFDDSPPDRLSERGYRMRARVGSGRLGPIYEAQDELSRSSGSQHFVALQLIDGRIASRPGFVADFERGAAELKSVSHPNIVRLLEYGRDKNRFFLVNELLESASLRFVLNDAGTLPEAETVAVLRAVGDALQYLHAKGMVHGNLRPENVLVTFGYEVKLLDIVPTGWLLGPNDALGIPARGPDKREDVFGLACLAYEMLSGRHPYNGNTAQEAYRSGLEPERLDNVNDRQWRALAAALAVHRDDRTPNVQQFLDEFGVGAAPRLKSVVTSGPAASAGAPASGRSAPGYAVPPPSYEAPEPTPAPERKYAHAQPVYAERPAREAPERRGIAGKLFALLLVIGLGVAAWYYQEPLRGFTSDLMGEVESRMAAERAATDRTTEVRGADQPLASAPAVTDADPATVLAPGAAPVEPDARTPAVREPAASPEDELARATVEPEPSPPAPARAQPAPTPLPAAPDPDVAEQEAPAPATGAVAPPASAAEIRAEPPAAPPMAAGPVRFVFQQDVVTVREGDVAARITIRRSGDLSGTATVSWWTAQGTAIADADYADLGARIERFAPGEASRTIYVPLTNDAVREPQKSFRVLLGRGEGGEPAAEARVDLIDDD